MRGKGPFWRNLGLIRHRRDPSPVWLHEEMVGPPSPSDPNKMTKLTYTQVMRTPIVLCC